jgi:hypothetical protein
MHQDWTAFESQFNAFHDTAKVAYNRGSYNHTRNLFKLIGHADAFDFDVLENDVDAIVMQLRAPDVTTRQRLDYAATLKRIFPAYNREIIPLPYLQLSFDASQEVKLIRKEHKLTAANRKNVPNDVEVRTVQQHLHEKVEQLVNESAVDKAIFQAMQDEALVSLFTLQPPRRSSEYCETKVWYDDLVSLPPEGNWYIVPTHMMYIRNYKNRRVGDRDYIFTLRNPDLRNQLDSLLRFRTERIVASNYLFVNDRHGPLNRVIVRSRILQAFSVVGKNTGPAALRIWFTSRNGVGKSMREHEDIAYLMGHSPYTHLSVYARDLDSSGEES